MSLLEFLQAQKYSSSGRVHVAPNIPKKLLSNALSAYGLTVDPSEVVVLIDDTMFASGKDGCLIGQQYLAIRESFSDAVAYAYDEVDALELKGSDTPLNPADNAVIQVNGRYLYGAPAAGNRLSGQVYVRPLREAVKALPGYEFGSVTEEELSQDFELDESVLDAQGQEKLTLESKWSEAKSPLQLIVQASLQESGGRPITRRLVQPVWPAEQLPGLRGLFDGKETDGDGPAEFEVLLANQQGDKLAADNLKVRLIRERRDYYWNYSDNDGWSYHYNEKFLNLDEQTVNIKAGDTAKVSFQVEWGPYRVEVEDPQTGLISSKCF